MILAPCITTITVMAVMTAAAPTNSQPAVSISVLGSRAFVSCESVIRPSSPPSLGGLSSTYGLRPTILLSFMSATKKQAAMTLPTGSRHPAPAAGHSRRDDAQDVGRCPVAAWPSVQGRAGEVDVLARGGGRETLTYLMKESLTRGLGVAS